MNAPPFQFDEFQHLGVDFNSPERVARNRRRVLLRDFIRGSLPELSRP
jgi:hypothetical protein